MPSPFVRAAPPRSTRLVVPLLGSMANTAPVADWTLTSVLPSAVLAIPFRLNPDTSWKSPVRGIVVAAPGVPFALRATL